MGIKQTKNGTYTVSVHKRHPVTRRPYSLRRTEIKSKVAAERVYRELAIKVEDKIRCTLIPTWEVILSEYLGSLGNTGLTSTTVYNREKVIRAHTLDVWSGRYTDRISTEDIRSLLESEFKNKSETHRKFFLSCIRYVFQYAVERGLIQRNPTPTIRFKCKDKIKSVLTEKHVMQLLQSAQVHDWAWYPHYALAVFTGLRNGELYALTWDKVDFERRQILVNNSWNNKDGFKSTKSGDDRLVEIPQPIIPVLKELKMEAGSQIFVLPRLAKWDKGEQARELRLFLRLQGLPEVRFHDLRATWATMLLSKGVASSKVMAMGGWKDMKTMLIYMRKSGIDIRGSTDVLDGLHTHGVKSAEVIKLRQM